MTRMKIDLGNDLPGNTCFIVPEGLALPEKPLPITWNYEQDSVLGKASNFSVVDDELEADVEWKPGTSFQFGLESDLIEFRPDFHVLELDVERAEDDSIIKATSTKAVLVGVSVCLKPAKEEGGKDG